MLNPYVWWGLVADWRPIFGKPTNQPSHQKSFCHGTHLRSDNSQCQNVQRLVTIGNKSYHGDLNLVHLQHAPGTLREGKNRWGCNETCVFGAWLEGKIRDVRWKSSVWSHVLHPNRPEPRCFLFLKVYSDTNHHGCNFLQVTWKLKNATPQVLGWKVQVTVTVQVDFLYSVWVIQLLGSLVQTKTVPNCQDLVHHEIDSQAFINTLR